MVIPFIFMSDVTHLTNYSRGKQVWPIYMMIGNISLEIRQKPSQMTSIVIAIIPNPPILGQTTTSRKNFLHDHKNLIVQDVIANILESFNVSDRYINDDEYTKFNATCADGCVRLYIPCVAGCIGDYPEHIKIQGLKSGLCFWCEFPANRLEVHGTDYEPHNSIEYQRVYQAGDFDCLEALGILPINNPLWDFQGPHMFFGQLSELPKPDVLHTLLLGMLKHLMEWIVPLLHDLGRLDTFDSAFLHSPAYLQRPTQRKRYQEVVH